MSKMALYRALVEAGASEERAKEAAQSVVYAPEGATKADIAEVNVNVAECKADMMTAVAGLRTEIEAMGTRLERSIREMSMRFLTLLIASQAVLFAGLHLTGD